MCKNEFKNNFDALLMHTRTCIPQIHQVLASDKIERINAPIAQLHFRTEDDRVSVIELEKKELEKVIESLEEAKEALARLNYSQK